MSNNIVLFSGGCDSTLVLYDKAMSLLKSGNTYDNITALTIRHKTALWQLENIYVKNSVEELDIVKGS